MTLYTRRRLEAEIADVLRLPPGHVGVHEPERAADLRDPPPPGSHIVFASANLALYPTERVAGVADALSRRFDRWALYERVGNGFALALLSSDR